MDAPVHTNDFTDVVNGKLQKKANQLVRKSYINASWLAISAYALIVVILLGSWIFLILAHPKSNRLNNIRLVGLGALGVVLLEVAYFGFSRLLFDRDTGQYVRQTIQPDAAQHAFKDTYFINRHTVDGINLRHE
jgi:hypothetical protein